jgi:hypothetical protein
MATGTSYRTPGTLPSITGTGGVGPFDGPA